jgi:hypothetical protein
LILSRLRIAIRIQVKNNSQKLVNLAPGGG